MLALETSTLAGSVALAKDGALLETALTPERRRTGELFPAIQTLYQRHGVAPRATRLVAFSAGPGSFTGLRAAATIARMFRSVAGSVVVAVPSLAAIACNLLDGRSNALNATSVVAVGVDARGGLLFGAAYRRVYQASFATLGPHDVPLDSDQSLVCVVSPAAYTPGEWLARLPAGAVVAGDAVTRHRERFVAADVTIAAAEFWTPRAAEVARLGLALQARGRVCNPEEIVPAYIRPPECEEVFEQRRDAARARRG